MRKFLITFLAFFLIPSLSFAAVAFKNTNTMAHSGTGVVTQTATINTGASEVAVVCLVYDGSTDLTAQAPTINGVAMTQVGTTKSFAGGSNQIFLAFYTMVSPPTGTVTVSSTISGTTKTDQYLNTIVYTGADQTNPARAGSFTSSTVSSASTISLTITSSASDLTTTCTSGNTTGLASTNQTSDGINNTGSDSAGSDHATTGAASVTHTWTFSASGVTAPIIGFSIQPPQAAATVNTTPTYLIDAPLIIFDSTSIFFY